MRQEHLDQSDSSEAGRQEQPGSCPAHYSVILASDSLLFLIL